MDFSWVFDISRDGRTILFNEQGVGGGPGYAVYLRGTRSIAGGPARQGHPAIAVPGRSIGARHGHGDEHADDPADRCWRVSRPADSTASRPTRGRAGFRTASASCSQESRTAKGQRMYVQDLTGGPPRPVTPEGVSERANTLTRTANGSSHEEGAAPALPGRRRRATAAEGRTCGRQAPLIWRDDGRVLFVRHGRLPARIFALDAADRTTDAGARDRAARSVGVDAMGDIRITPDGKSYAYVFITIALSLYQVTGLR